MALDILSWKKEFLKRKQSSNEEAEATAAGADYVGDCQS